MADIQQVKNCVEELLLYAEEKLEMRAEDKIYNRNLILAELKLDSPAPPAEKYGDFQSILDTIVDYAAENGICGSEERIIFETKMLGMLSPMPSTVIDTFDGIVSNYGVKAATDWLFDISVANNYIRTVDINKNIKWKHEGNKGGIEVTINLSKPEKDPKQIALAKLQKKSGYPACMLCIDNVGYQGNLNHPARQTLRTIPVTLNNESWNMQFSPYQYYYQHVIAFATEHRPMDVNNACIQRLFDFVELFPHYFMGSNAALPIVGGSILTHDHYQGGAKVLPMFSAPLRKVYDYRERDVKVSTVDWYNSVVRVESKIKSKAVIAACDIMNKWKNYSDESCNIICRTTEPHNAVTPIARKENDAYVIDMILRNNRTDETHPYGIYHPTEDLHNIKKEGIGIIEVMGTFILPGRLKAEMSEVEKYLTGEHKLDIKELFSQENPMSKHAGMITQLCNDNGNSLTPMRAHETVVAYINNACERILECTAVFKNTDKGQEGFERFMQSVIK